MKNAMCTLYGGRPHDSMIIQLRSAIFGSIRNVQIKALQSVFISFLASDILMPSLS